MDTAILTNSLNQFLTVFNAAYGLIWANGGQALLWVLAGIELVLVALWWAFPVASSSLWLLFRLAT